MASEAAASSTAASRSAWTRGNRSAGSTTAAQERYDPLEIMLESYMDISCVIAWTMLTLCGLGMVSNIMSIAIYSHPNMRRAPINVLLTGLSVIDLCLSLLSIPAFVVPGFYSSYETSLLNTLMCYSSVYVYPLTSMTHTASVWTFVIIAVERWQAVCGGASGGAMVTGRQTLLRRQRRRSSAYALAAVCALSFAYNFVRFFEFRLVYRVNEEEGEYSSESVDGIDDGHYWDTSEPAIILAVEPVLKNATVYPAYMSVYYVGLFLVTHFTAPFIALLVVNGLTLRAVYVARQRRRRLLTRRERKEHRTTWMMMTVVLTFVGCYTLLFTLNIIEAVDAEWFYKEDNKMTSYALNDISNMLVVMNSATTAVIYFIFNRNYRELCMSLMAKWFACCWCCCWHTRHRFYQRNCNQVASGRRSNQLSTADGYELSDVTTPCIAAAADIEEANTVRNGFLYAMARKDGSSLISSTSSSFRNYQNHAAQ